ncbi:hypothetical protein V8F20_008319 [Naviculisporaceae sp. PSN 640]
MKTELKKLALRLGFGQSKDRNTPNDKGKAKETETSQISSIVHHAAPELNQTGIDGQALITQSDMATSADSQSICLFFSRLPLEIRRLIYREVWKGYLESTCRQVPMPMPRISTASTPNISASQALVTAPALFQTDLGLHIYTDGTGGTKLGHTLCRVHDSPPDQGTHNRLSIQPWMYQDGNHPPMWLWRAWVMRQHWNRHWKCQSAVMKRWDPETGSVTQTERSPFLPMFLTCKKMYWEAISSFFENVTPIFTSSKDAHRFFVLHPHPFAGHIRTLELNFTDQNDHLFLQQIAQPDVEGGEIDEIGDAEIQGMGEVETDRATGDEPGESSAMATASNHLCSTPRCCLNLFGQQLLDQILDGIQEQIPGLKDLAITITGRMDHGPILDRFAYLREEEPSDATALSARNVESKDAVTANPSSAVETDDAAGPEAPESEASTREKWALPGNVNIKFEAEGLRHTIRRGRKLVQTRLDSI